MRTRFLAILAAAATVLTSPHARAQCTLSASPRYIDLNGPGVSFDPQTKVFLIPRTLFFSAGDVGACNPDEVGVVVTGGQGGTWSSNSASNPNARPLPFVTFERSFDCGSVGGTFQLRIFSGVPGAPVVESPIVDFICSFDPNAPQIHDVSDTHQVDQSGFYETTVNLFDWCPGGSQPCGLEFEPFIPGVDPSQSDLGTIRLFVSASHPPCEPIVYRFRVRSEDCFASPFATYSLTFTPHPQAPLAMADALQSRVGDPIRIPVLQLLANDVVVDVPIDESSLIVTGSTGGTAVKEGNGFEPGIVVFTPDAAGCQTVGFTYSVRDIFGRPSCPPAAVTIELLPPLVDCNENCLVDAGEPDADQDGLPDDCETIVGPCDVKRQVPASLLLFPLFDNRIGNVTLATVTNTNTSFLDGPGGLPAGTVDVEFVYIARYGLGDVELPCLETNHTRRLTPGDTLTLFTGADNPNAELGYFYAFAKSPLTGAAISWNHLVGELLLVSGLEDFEDSVSALAFCSPLRERAPTDSDGDGIRDLDGVEYDGAPGELLFPRFLGQDPPGMPGGHASRLVLVALSGGAQFDTLLRVTTFNDNEQAFSDQLGFRCWASLLLTEVSGTFLNEFLANSEQNSPLESIGEPAREYGWLKLDGAVASSSQDEIHDPAFYAVLFERVGAHGMVSPPWELCSQLNGDLVAQGIFEER